MPNLEQLQQDHDTLNDMYVTDKAADAITPDDQETYAELVNDNREGFKKLIVESKSSGPIEIPVAQHNIGRKATQRVIDPTYAQAFNDNWNVNDR